MSYFEDGDIPLLDTLDIDIMMHREIHFGGSFSIMLDYYEHDGVGVCPDFPIKRIKKLMEEEQKSGYNLAETLLPSSAYGIIEDAKTTYLNLRAIYEHPTSPPLSLVMADLILSEDDNPQEEIDAVCRHEKAAVGPLIELIKTEKLYDPLYPGYGRAPLLAAQCLANIRDPRAIPALFGALGKENFFADDALISALVSFGQEAIDFLLVKVAHPPFNKDNEHAAIALSSFSEEPRIAKLCLHLLEQAEMKKHPTLANYLILCCSGLKTTEEREKFLRLKDQFPGMVKHEFDLIAKEWFS